MVIPPPKEQDTGLAHCHYIRQLAQEIWNKENAQYGKNLEWNECMRRALMLHRKKLINNQVDKIIPKTPTGLRVGRRLGW